MKSTIEIPYGETGVFAEVCAGLKREGIAFTATLSADYFLITLS